MILNINKTFIIIASIFYIQNSFAQYNMPPVEDDKFTDGEDMTGPTATFKIVSGGIVQGATNITDNFELLIKGRIKKKSVSKVCWPYPI